MLRKLWKLLTIMIIVAFTAQGGAFAAQADQPSREALQGIFSIIWGDGQPGTGVSLERYFITLENGQTLPLEISPSAWPERGALALNRQSVVVWGHLSSPDWASFDVDQIELNQDAHTESVIGSKPWISIMCKFSDVAAEPKDLAFFTGMYANVFPGIDHFWREVSFNLVNLNGSSAVGWYTLPYPRDHYLPGGNLDWGAAASDCTAVADADVNFRNYRDGGINLMFNALLDCCAWGGSMYLELDGVGQEWRMTWEPPWGYENVGVIAHETGHGFGLPHSSGDYGEVYDNQWDVMSDVWVNESRGGSHPIYGTIGQHTIAYHKAMLGWISTAKQMKVASGAMRIVTLERLGNPQTNNYMEVIIPINGSAYNYYTVEARQDTAATGYDNWLPGTAVVIHKVNEYLGEPAHVVDIDGNGNTGDEGAMWRVGEKFYDAANNISVEVLTATATGFVVKVANNYYMSDLSLTGPQSGRTGQALTYTAKALPASVLQPVTFTWQATGQEPITQTGSTTRSVQYTWMEPGTQVITVTATNPGGSLSEVLTVDVSQPLTGTQLSGPEMGLAGVTATLTATVAPLDASLPIQYTWQAAGHDTVVHTAGVSDTIDFLWSEPGTAVVTVTASNTKVSFTDVYSWPVYVPLEAVQLDGVDLGLAGEVYTFTAQLSPTWVAQPVTYTWRVDGQEMVTHTGGLSDTASFAWHESGVYTISLEAENATGSVAFQHLVEIGVSPQVTLPGPEQGLTGISYIFVATVQPTATLPLTYTWQVDGETVITHLGGLSDAFTVTWVEPGTHTVSVAVTNRFGTSVQAWDVAVDTRIYMPLAVR